MVLTGNRGATSAPICGLPMELCEMIYEQLEGTSEIRSLRETCVTLANAGISALIKNISVHVLESEIQDCVKLLQAHRKKPKSITFLIDIIEIDDGLLEERLFDQQRRGAEGELKMMERWPIFQHIRRSESNGRSLALNNLIHLLPDEIEVRVQGGFFPKAFPGLERFRLHGFHTQRGVIPARMVLRSLQHIEHTLKAFRVGGFSQDLFDLLDGTIKASLSKVEDFSFVMNERFDTVDQDELDAVQFSKTCGGLFQPMSLKTLDVRGPEVATQHALRIANFLPSISPDVLSKLRLSGVATDSPEELICGLTRLPRLQQLALGSITFASGSRLNKPGCRQTFWRVIPLWRSCAS